MSSIMTSSNGNMFFVSSLTASYLPWPTPSTSSSTRTVSWLLTRLSHKFAKKWRDLSSRWWTTHSPNFRPTIFSKNFQLQRARAPVRDLYPKFDPGAFFLEDVKNWTIQFDRKQSYRKLKLYTVRTRFLGMFRNRMAFNRTPNVELGH